MLWFGATWNTCKSVRWFFHRKLSRYNLPYNFVSEITAWNLETYFIIIVIIVKILEDRVLTINFLVFLLSFSCRLPLYFRSESFFFLLSIHFLSNHFFAYLVPAFLRTFFPQSHLIQIYFSFVELCHIFFSTGTKIYKEK